MKIFKAIISFFTNNWGLKLISLLLAIVIYHSGKTDRVGNSNNLTHDRPIIQIP